VRRTLKKIAVSIGVGSIVTSFALAIAFLTDGGLVSRMLLWPWVWLAATVPHGSIGTAAHPVIEGSPLDVIAAFVGLALTALFYSSVAFLVASSSPREHDQKA
jgi:uncharacterized membrane protein